LISPFELPPVFPFVLIAVFPAPVDCILPPAALPFEADSAGDSSDAGFWLVVGVSSDVGDLVLVLDFDFAGAFDFEAGSAADSPSSPSMTDSYEE
jgi:hypothetical protein